MQTENYQSDEVEQLTGELLTKAVELLEIPTPLMHGTVDRFSEYLELVLGKGEERQQQFGHIKNNPEDFIQKNRGEIISIIDPGRAKTAIFNITVRRKDGRPTPEVMGKEYSIGENMSLNIGKDINHNLLIMNFIPELPNYRERVPIIEYTEADPILLGVISKDGWQKIADTLLESRNSYPIASLLVELKFLYVSYINRQFRDGQEQSLLTAIAEKSEQIRSYFTLETDIPLWAMYYCARANLNAGQQISKIESI